MKNTLDTSDIVNALMADNYAKWSLAAAQALTEYLEDIEEECDMEIELDVVALRCEYSEYESLDEWAQSYFCADQLDELLGTVDYEAEKIQELDRADTLAAAGEHGDAVQIRGWYEDDEIEREEHKETTLRAYIAEHGQLIEFSGGIIVSAF